MVPAHFRVLVVDDSLFVAKQITKFLSGSGFEVVATARDGQEGLEKYKRLSENIDVVTMDVTMPRMNGIASLEQILAFNKNAKVIMITALGRPDLVKKALVIGAKGYVIKPLNPKKILECLRRVVDS